MAKFTTALLRHSSIWNIPESETKEINGFPENVIFKWNQGYEILHFINRYMEHRGWHAPVTFQKIESAIKTRLPFSAKTHHDVKLWLDANVKP
ncbi:hypothetical protein GR160_05410 [Flavobacterium sp. Sd200]|uniref:hypothetical protein n=1 Tax=Flavobacterium sp. Sd200 TaxID=2692211 RepID=UPI00136A3A9B|nr:hypothetical protein [Flavobacterium sp. Sd200]MXN90656.1 hypothetical protein [Flavobacterium sp. Sd200]